MPHHDAVAQQQQLVHVITCPNPCTQPPHPLLEPQQLECGHILCRQCLDSSANTSSGGNKKLHCPYETCGKLSDTHASKPLAISYQLPASQTGLTVAAAAEFDPPMTDAYGKIMEPDLMHDVDADSDHKGIACPGFDYADFAKHADQRRDIDRPYVHQEPDDVDGQWNVNALIDALLKHAKQFFPIQGFSASPDQQKLYVDIDKGTKPETQRFFREKLPEHAQWLSQRIVLIEQETQAEFLIHTGGKIAVCPAAIQLNIDRIDSLQRYGTLTCLGADRYNRTYALTAKHIINTENRPSEGDESIISSLYGTVSEISGHYKGVLGGFGVGGRDKQVDIAAAQLHDHVTSSFDQNKVHNLSPTYTGPDADLYGVRVTKRGATTADTWGVIVKTSHYKNNPRQMTITGDHFVVAPNNGSFAISGDSGALVWSTSGVPIGIVSKGQPRFRYCIGNDEYVKDVVFCVRLDNCLSALNAECHVTITRCQSYGARLPYEEYVPLPQLDDHIHVQPAEQQMDQQ